MSREHYIIYLQTLSYDYYFYFYFETFITEMYRSHNERLALVKSG